MSNRIHSGTLTQARYAQNQGRKVFVMSCIDGVNEDNGGWKTLKEEIEPVLAANYEDILDEICDFFGLYGVKVRIDNG